MQKKVHWFLAVLVFVVGLGVFCSSEVTAVADTEQVKISVSYGQTEARTILGKVNSFRTGGNAWYWNSDNQTKTQTGALPALQYDYDLEKVAMKRAVEIALNFSHTRPDGSSCFTAYTELGYAKNGAGENIAAGYGSAEAAFAGWLEENASYSGQGHRRNMLQNYTAMAVAHVVVDGVHFWVQEFNCSVVNPSATAANNGTAEEYVFIDTDMVDEVYPEFDIRGTHIELYDANLIASLGGNIINSTYMLYGGCGESFAVNNCKLRLRMEDSFSAVALLQDLSWTSLDANVAKVTDGKTLTAVSEGSTVLTADVFGNLIMLPVAIEHMWDDGKETSAPNCVNDGSILYTCTGCGTTYSNFLPPLGHDMEGYFSPASLEADGFTADRCTRCFSMMNISVIPRIDKVELEKDVYTYKYKTYRKPKVTAVDSEGTTIEPACYSVKYSGYAKVGTATATVTFDSLFYKTETVIEYTINPAPTSIKKIVPKSGGFTISWKKVSKQCSGYELQYSTKNSMKGAKTVIVNGYKTLKYLLADLKKNKTYYVRLRTFKIVENQKYYSDWSGLQSVRTGK